MPRPRPTLCLLALGLASSVWGAPARGGERVLYDDTISRIQSRYLDPDSVSVRAALELAGEAAEDAVPWLIVEPDEDGITLVHGTAGVIGHVDAVSGGLEDLPDALELLEDTIVAASQGRWDDAPAPGLDDDLDLPVELLRGVARALDRHSVVLSGDRLDRFDERISGRLHGIGARISREGDRLIVRDVFAGGPAAEGGLQPGDRVIKVDGAATIGMTVSDTTARIRGPEGSQVLLDVERPLPDGTARAFQLFLTRAEVRIPNVTYEVDGDIGSLRITHFSEQTVRLMREALADFQAAGVKGIVIDLRQNSGGSMLQACQAADLFLEDGPVLRTAGRGGAPVHRLIQSYEAERSDLEPQVPVVVLVGSRSASASEILAGALLLRDRAVLVGDRSHGKGTVQKLYTLRRRDGAPRTRLKLTVARYLLPDDTPIETGVGLAPDLEVDAVVFDDHGAYIPTADDDAPARVVWADERPGWRGTGLAEPRGDRTEQLAEAVIRATASAHRADLLAAIDTLAAAESVSEEQLVERTFAYQSLDWSPATAPGPAPSIRATLEAVDTLEAGGPATELRVHIENTGPDVLHRVWVSLDSEAGRLPWDGVTLPVGRIPPGEARWGKAYVEIDDDEPDRVDLVGLTVHAHQRPDATSDRTVLRIRGNPPPAVRTTARLEADPTTQELSVVATFENMTERALPAPRMKVAVRDDSPLELAARSVDGAELAPRGELTLRFPLHAREPIEPDAEVPLKVRLEVAPWNRILSVPVSLTVGGAPQMRLPPAIVADVPLQVESGPLVLPITVRDDVGVDEVLVWFDGEKVAWHGASTTEAGRAKLDVPLQIGPGPHAVVVRAIDSDGARTRRVYWIRGLAETAEPAADGVVEHAPDSP